MGDLIKIRLNFPNEGTNGNPRPNDPSSTLLPRVKGTGVYGIETYRLGQMLSRYDALVAESSQRRPSPAQQEQRIAKTQQLIDSFFKCLSALHSKDPSKREAPISSLSQEILPALNNLRGYWQFANMPRLEGSISRYIGQPYGEILGDDASLAREIMISILSNNSRKLDLRNLCDASRTFTRLKDPQSALIEEQVRRLNRLGFCSILPLSSRGLLKDSLESFSDTIEQQRRFLRSALSSLVRNIEARIIFRAALEDLYPNNIFSQSLLVESTNLPVAILETEGSLNGQSAATTQTDIQLELSKLCAQFIGDYSASSTYACMAFLKGAARCLSLAGHNPELLNSLENPEILILPIIDVVFKMDLYKRADPAEGQINWPKACKELITSAFRLFARSPKTDTAKFLRFLETLQFRNSLGDLPEAITFRLASLIEDETITRITKVLALSGIRQADPRTGSDPLASATLLFFNEINYLPIKLIETLGTVMRDSNLIRDPLLISDPICSLHFFSQMGRHQVPPKLSRLSRLCKSTISQAFTKALDSEYLAKAVNELILQKPQLSNDEMNVLVHSLRGLACAAFTVAREDKAAFVEIAVNLGLHLCSQAQPGKHGPLFLGNRLAQLYCLLEMPMWRELISDELGRLDLCSDLKFSDPGQPHIGESILAQILRDHFTASNREVNLTDNLETFQTIPAIQNVKIQTFAGTQLLGYEIDFLMIAHVQNQAGTTERFCIAFELDGRRFHIRKIDANHNFPRVIDSVRDRFFKECGIFTIRLNGEQLNEIRNLSSLAALVEKQSEPGNEDPNASFLRNLIKYCESRRSSS